MQETIDVLETPELYVPALQFIHVLLASIELYEPTGQLLHIDEARLLYFPVEHCKHTVAVMAEMSVL